MNGNDFPMQMSLNASQNAFANSRATVLITKVVLETTRKIHPSEISLGTAGSERVRRWLGADLLLSYLVR